MAYFGMREGFENTQTLFTPKVKCTQGGSWGDSLMDGVGKYLIGDRHFPNCCPGRDSLYWKPYKLMMSRYPEAIGSKSIEEAGLYQTINQSLTLWR